MISCVDDTLYVAAAAAQASEIKSDAVVRAALGVAVATVNAAASKQIYDMQYQIADRNQNLAESIRAHWRGDFWPRETRFVADAFDAPAYVGQYQAAGDEYVGIGQRMQASVFREVQIDLREQCIKLTACDLAALARRAAKSNIDLRNHAFRQEEVREQAKKDQHYARRYDALGLGRGVLQTSSEYGRVAGQLAGGLAKQVQQSIGGALQYVGLSLSRVQRADIAGIQMRAEEIRAGRAAETVSPVRAMAFTSPVNLSAVQGTALGPLTEQ